MGSNNPTSGCLWEGNENRTSDTGTHVVCSIIHTSQDTEATKVYLNRWMDKEDTVHTHTVYAMETEANPTICNNTYVLVQNSVLNFRQTVDYESNLKHLITMYFNNRPPYAWFRSLLMFYLAPGGPLELRVIITCVCSVSSECGINLSPSETLSLCNVMWCSCKNGIIWRLAISGVCFYGSSSPHRCQRVAGRIFTNCGYF